MPALTHNSLPLPRAASLTGSAVRSQSDHEAFTVVGVPKRGQRQVVLAEQSPRVRRTVWRFGDMRSGRVLSLPGILFALVLYRGAFENLFGFFVLTPYGGRKTMLYHTVLPNTGVDGWVCIGDDAQRERLARETRELPDCAAKMSVVLHTFWNVTSFTEQLIDRLTVRGARLHPNLATLATWERASRVNPDFVFDPAWMQKINAKEPEGSANRQRGAR